MFKNLPTGTKLFILCATFLISIAVPIYGLVTEKRVAIDFSRKELLGSRYLSTLRQIYAAVLADAIEAKPAEDKASRAQLIAALALAEQQSGTHLQTAELASAFGTALTQLWATEQRPAQRSGLLLDALFTGQTLAARIGDDSNLALDPDLDTYYLQNIVVRKLPTFA